MSIEARQTYRKRMLRRLELAIGKLEDLEEGFNPRNHPSFGSSVLISYGHHREAYEEVDRAITNFGSALRHTKWCIENNEAIKENHGKLQAGG